MMKKTLKQAGTFLLASLLTASMAACSSQKAPENQPQPSVSQADSKESTEAPKESGQKAEASSGEKVTIRFSWWGSDTRHEATLKVMDMYMEKHPNVTIEGEYGAFDSFYQKLQTQLGGGTEPDIISVDYK